ncbi:MAG: hypothetical protein ACRDIW_10875 [Actinomycetota bacterium]|jgi:hypothetical protein
MTVELNEAERTVVECYRTLAGVLETQRDQLPPFAERNALKALAALWQVANGLDQDPGQLYELGA